MNYRSVAQLSAQVWSWSRKLPPDLDLVVGIPRSGLLAAHLVALYRNLPLTDIDGLLGGWTPTGSGAAPVAENGAHPAKLKVLVVDDSVRSGEAMRKARETITAARLPHEIYYGAVYVRPDSTHFVDFFCEALPVPRVFEWNMLHKEQTSCFCIELDGVLCEAPPLPLQGDEMRERELLESLPPLHLPTRKVGWVVAGRPEEYRSLTEEWLARHGVEYGELIMVAGAERRGAPPVERRAEIYQRTAAKLYLAASLHQAAQLAALADRPVLAMDTRQMIFRGRVPKNRYAIPHTPRPSRYLDVATRRLRKLATGLVVLVSGTRMLSPRSRSELRNDS